ncbi:hypothetical protein [Massilia sp. DWR3-1-1]|uniref:hypothetical protein n=1 Tax=Massilia sp. DWR3-1-1 TaxID=2804559 RepID=UPI003CF28E40
MSATRRPAGNGDNILARLERSGGNGGRGTWSGPARAAALAGVLATAALVWLLIGLTQDKLQERREAQVVVVTPTPVEPPASAKPEAALDTAREAPVARQVEAPPDPTSLEPIPVLPMLADVVEKAPAAPPARAPHRPTATPPPARSAPTVAAKAGSAHGPRVNLAPPVAGKGADAAIDNDVALLSAILIHAPRHRAERARAEEKCKTDKKCTMAGPLPALLHAGE